MGWESGIWEKGEVGKEEISKGGIRERREGVGEKRGSKGGYRATCTIHLRTCR